MTPRWLRPVAAMLVVFGVAEVVTAFRHTFFGLRTADAAAFTVGGAALGLCYVASGVLVAMQRRGPARVAVGLLAVDVVGRIGLVVTGLFPVDDARQVAGIVGGTAIALAVVIAVARVSDALPR